MNKNQKKQLKNKVAFEEILSCSHENFNTYTEILRAGREYTRRNTDPLLRGLLSHKLKQWQYRVNN